MIKRLIVCNLGALLLACAGQISASAFIPATTQATRALDWIQQTKLAADGSVGGDATRTEETIWGLAANHRPVAAYLKTGSTSSPIDYLAANLASEEASAGSIAQLILAVSAAGQDPTSFGPSGGRRDLLADLQALYNSSTGEFGSDKVFDHIMAVLAIRSAGRQPAAAAIAFLKGQQKSDGGWSFDNASSFGTDTNTTALALIALASTSSLDGCQVAAALAYLKTAQQADGGFPLEAAFPTSDPDSDGFVIQGLLAVGQDPTGPAWTKAGGKNPLINLLSFQNTDGSFSYPGIQGSNLTATTQPLVALASNHLPISAAGTSFGSPDVPTCEQASSSPTPAATTSSPSTLPQTGQPVDLPLAHFPGLLFLLLVLSILLGVTLSLRRNR